MQRYSRKSTPQVTGGKVRKKNNWEPSDSYYERDQPWPVIDRKRPGAGYRHLLTKQDLSRFIHILPDWRELSVGLNAIVLAPGDPEVDGYHTPGVVHVCAWDEGMWVEYTEAGYEEHRDILARLGVPCEPLDDGSVRCKFEARSARAYQLLHILLHELGHHHDRMTSRRQRCSGRGESYAEAYARLYMDRIWKDCAQMLDLF